MSSATLSDEARDRPGLAAGLACYVMWGLLPLLFQAAGRAGADGLDIVAWRTVFSLPVAAALVVWVGQGRALLALGPRDWAVLALSAALIAVNWLVYVWAVTHGRTLEGALGYYINPLLNMLAGRLLFGERMDRAGWVAGGLAAAGVAVQTAALGAFPWVSVALAASFCGYGIVRKRARAPAQAGLAAECAILLLPAVGAIAWMAGRPGGEVALLRGPEAAALLVLCGPATVAPLACFAIAARRLPLTTLGFLQFVGPTLQFGVGVANGEALTPLRLASFALIWAGVAVFVGAALWRGRAERRAVSRAAQPA